MPMPESPVRNTPSFRTSARGTAVPRGPERQQVLETVRERVRSGFYAGEEVSKRLSDKLGFLFEDGNS